jgi:hypothetical protein
MNINRQGASYLVVAGRCTKFQCAIDQAFVRLDQVVFLVDSFLLQIKFDLCQYLIPL